ncbi:hypothetical protein BDL97_13G005100 [Sphagnum fallax]|nr:hypothetical protein BDL97_13G005100 [Sphagnum fallax]
MQGAAMEDVVAAVVIALAALVLVAGANADAAGDLVVLPPPSPATTTTAANTTTSTTAAGAPVIPTLACSTSPARDLTVCQLTDCGERMPALFPCLSYLQTNTALPNAECCAALQQLSVASLICFCDVTFYPPVGLNISLPLQYAMPSYCNIKTDVCSVCPASLTTPVPSQVTCSKAYGPAPAPEILKIEGKPTVYSYSVLKTATRNFHQGSKLGEGGFGAVYKGVLPDGTEVAVKQLSVSSRQGKEEFLNEVMLITGVQHRNLVKLRGCCLKGDERLLVYEFLENRSLHQALFDETRVLKLDWPTRLKILVGTARGLAYLHEGCSTRIIHRDIKASNILLDRDLNPKIADFGLARLFQDNQSHRVFGTGICNEGSTH